MGQKSARVIRIPDRSGREGGEWAAAGGRPVPPPRRGALFDRTTIMLLGGALILAVAMGVRQTYGLFTTPLAIEGLPVETFAFAIALQNLIWGAAQPFAGAAADRWGAGWVVVGGGVLYAAGLAIVAAGQNPLTAILGAGLLVGFGVSAMSFSVVLGVIGRNVSDQRRSLALGIASAGGSFGQVVVPLAAQWAIETRGTALTFYALGAVALLVVPLALTLGRGRTMPSAPVAPAEVRKPAAPANMAAEAAVALAGEQSLTAALIEARQHFGYILLTIGFFVCGFQLAFIAVHLPGFLATCHLPAAVGAEALAVIGLFNMLGSWGCGFLGGRYRPKYLLSSIYLIRVVTIGAFLLLPKTELNVLIFAAVMGTVWLGTVPLTSVLVAGIFGPRYMGTLFGIVFFSHQVGAFFGAWLGGYVYTVTGSYYPVWFVAVALGIAAAIIHLPIADRSIRTVTA